MNLHKAYEQRDKLNEKMSLLLLQGLRGELANYLKAIENYPPDRMEKYGQPFVDKLEEKIRNVEQMIATRFNS